MVKKKKVTIFWFRRDLRIEDNVGLFHSLNSEFPVVPIFIFDENILNTLEDKTDRRVDYIHQVIKQLNNKLLQSDSTIKTFYGNPLHTFKELTQNYDVKAIYCNRDYEPACIRRDIEIYLWAKENNIAFKIYKDQVIFDKSEIVKKDGLPYTIYTPYAKRWKESLTAMDLKTYMPDLSNLLKQEFKNIISLKEIGFNKTDLKYISPILDSAIIDQYDRYRDFPALQKTTQLGIALRFGTISIRKCVKFALAHNQMWLNELIWREFFMQILYFYPKVVNQSFKSKYDDIQWLNNEEEFNLWCEGKTGYPLVDAGMRQLNKTGYMHNRARMITASFLCKHLLIDWRWGESYFAQKLNDFDLSANNGNWQWVAGSGCDSAPYFRIFNPKLQMQKFDKDFKYIGEWIPEFNTALYPKEIIEHTHARNRMNKVYQKALQSTNFE